VRATSQDSPLTGQQKPNILHCQKARISSTSGDDRTIFSRCGKSPSARVKVDWWKERELGSRVRGQSYAACSSEKVVEKSVTLSDGGDNLAVSDRGEIQRNIWGSIKAVGIEYCIGGCFRSKRTGRLLQVEQGW